MSEKSEKFSPQAISTMESIVKSVRPYEGKNLSRHIKMDTRGEVLVVHGEQPPQLTEKALRYIARRIFEKTSLISLDLSENEGVGNSGRENQVLSVRKKASLALVGISESEKATNTDDEHQGSKDLAEGHKSE